MSINLYLMKVVKLQQPQQKQTLYSVEILIVNKSYSQQQNNSSIQKSCVVYSIFFSPESAEIHLKV